MAGVLKNTQLLVLKKEPGRLNNIYTNMSMSGCIHCFIYIVSNNLGPGNNFHGTISLKQGWAKCSQHSKEQMWARIQLVNRQITDQETHQQSRARMTWNVNKKADSDHCQATTKVKFVITTSFSISRFLVHKPPHVQKKQQDQHPRAILGKREEGWPCASQLPAFWSST